MLWKVDGEADIGWGERVVAFEVDQAMHLDLKDLQFLDLDQAISGVCVIDKIRA